MNILVYGTLVGAGGIAHHTREFTKRLSTYHTVKVVNFPIPPTVTGPYSVDMFSYLDELEDIHHQMLYQQSLWNSENRDNVNQLIELPLTGYDETFKYDLVIVMAEAHHYYYYRDYKINGKPTVAYFPWETELVNPYFFNQLLNFDQIWVPSNWQRTNLINQGSEIDPDKVKVVPLGVCTENYFPVDKEEKKVDKLTFLHIGTFSERKSSYEICKNFIDLYGDNPNFELRLSIGNKIYSREEDEAAIFEKNNLPICSNIKFLGTLTEKEYIQEFKNADVYLSCSRGEGWNFPLIQALASGIPSVWSKVGGQIEYASGAELGCNWIKTIPASNFYPSFTGNFYEPDFNQFTKHIIDVVNNYSYYKRKALEYADFIKVNFNRNVSVDKANRFIKELTNNLSNIYYLVHSTSFGDTLGATPTLRYLSNSHESLINVVTHCKKAFKNNPYVEELLSFDEYEEKTKNNKEITYQSFTSAGTLDGNGIEKKFTHIDARQIHAIDLGFQLTPEQLHYDFIPDEFKLDVQLPNEYVVLHITENWPNRTWAYENWYALIQWLAENNIFTVLIGQGYTEKLHTSLGKNVLEKACPFFDNLYGIDLSEQGTISDMWHVMNKAVAIITMDSGPLHLAGTTDSYIIQLGSAIHPSLRAPFRNGDQSYKYSFVGGSCNLFCNSNLKYNIAEWKHINAVPPLPGCLENKKTFECHPSVTQVVDKIENLFSCKKNVPRFDVKKVQWTGNRIEYGFIGGEGSNGTVNVYDKTTGLRAYSIFHANLYTESDQIFWIEIYADKYSTFDCIVKLEVDGVVLDEIELVRNSTQLEIVKNIPITKDLFSDNFINTENSYLTYWEIFVDKTYEHPKIQINPGDVVLDIGGNHGLFTLFALQKQAKKVYTVEPSKECFTSLDKLSTYFNEIEKINAAVFNIDGKATLLSSINNSACNHLQEVDFNPGVNLENNYTVPTVHINTLLQDIYKSTSIDFLKIDCEGSELRIMEAVDLTLLTKIPKLAMEVHSREKLNRIEKILSPYYDIHLVEHDLGNLTIFCKLKTAIS